MNDSIFMRAATIDTQKPSIRNAQSQGKYMDTIVATIYKINQQVNHKFKIVKVQKHLIANKMKKIYQIILLFVITLIVAATTNAQTAWFVDGYHGGVYGHYPIWQARFMVEKLTEIPDWKISLEIEPETWDSVSVNDAENFKALQEYYKTTGRFGRIEFVNPTWAQPYCYNISGESIIRQFDYGIKKIHQYFPDATFETYSVEEPCFTSSLPQILKGFGFKYAVLRNPNTCWGGYTSRFGKDMVNWIGPDGTTIPAVPRYECEELSETNTFATASANQSADFIAACFADGIKYPVGMCFQDAGWQHGPWLDNFIKDFYHPTVYTTWTDYINMIKDKVEPDNWRFSVEDVKPGLVWGAQVLQKIAQEVRVSENKLITAEKMAAFDYLFNGTPWPADDFAEGWRTLMLSQHHDCWIVPYNGQPGNTWADNVTRWTNSSNVIADDKISKLFGDENDPNFNTIKVFNTLGTERTDYVTILLPKTLNSDEVCVYDNQGKTVQSQVITNAEGNRILQFEATVPAMGFTTFELKRLKNSSSNKTTNITLGEKVKIETPFYNVTFDVAKGGTITSLIDKMNSNKELVEKGKLLNNLRGFFYNEQKFHESSETHAMISIVENGELYTRVKIENQIGGNNYYQFITFNKNNPRIDFELHIDWNGRPGIGAYDQSRNFKAEERQKAFYNDNYKLHIEFPLNGLGEKLYKNAPFDVCESRLENTLYSSWDSIKHNVILNWADVENAAKDYGVALLTDHTTSYLQTKEMPLGLTVQYIGKGLWGRDYSVHGPTHIHYALFPHTGNWEQADIEFASAAWNEPLVAEFVENSKEAQFSLLETLDKNLLVSSLKIDGEDLYVRFYNTSSKDKKQQVIWNCTAEKIELVDLNGKTISSLQPEKEKNGQLKTSLSLPQFGFQTIKLLKVKLNKSVIPKQP